MAALFWNLKSESEFQLWLFIEVGSLCTEILGLIVLKCMNVSLRQIGSDLLATKRVVFERDIWRSRGEKKREFGAVSQF